jgi:polyribonucleotide nucleotidyltransferase
METGQLARQAAGSCLVQYAGTVVLCATATAAPRPGIDFFPLTCDYRERTSAAGKFPGGFIKREGRPSLKEVLTSRLMDRPIRPLFPEWFKDEVQIQAMVLSSDRQHDSDVLAMNGAAATLGLAGLPFLGPLASVRLGSIDGEFVVFPSHDALEECDLDLIVSGTRDAILMIEGFAREMPEEEMVRALMQAHQHIRDLCSLQQELIDRVGVTARVAEVDTARDDQMEQLRASYYGRLKAAKQTAGKQARAEAVADVKSAAAAERAETSGSDGAAEVASFDTLWHDLEQRVVRDLILEGSRPDGRDLTSLRPIECHVDVLPRVHGSAIFQRGETQALISITLGTGRDEQRVDGLFEEYSKKFMLDYNFPPFSVGEVRPIRGPGRREMGHGALAERSVNPVLPDPDRFPYTIRVVSDILESNGSSSMASVCGATLGLMAAGVPITNPVAGISIGLVKEKDRWVLLTDIIGDEDHFGDMDFKVAGTQNGITGIQLDLKIAGISEEIVRATLKQAREARLQILRRMLTAISRPREHTSPWAPRLLRVTIDPEKIGMLIGPGGKTVRAIQDELGVQVDIQDDGTVTIASADQLAADAAVARVEALTASVQVGRIYQGRVTSVKDFGAFVEILPGKDGLCHISELSDQYVSSVSDVCRVGDTIHVKVIAVDEQDRVKLSRRVAMQEMAEQTGGGNGER